jgi:hypothetical protein
MGWIGRAARAEERLTGADQADDSRTRTLSVIEHNMDLAAGSEPFSRYQEDPGRGCVHATPVRIGPGRPWGATSSGLVVAPAYAVEPATTVTPRSVTSTMLKQRRPARNVGLHTSPRHA